MPERNALIGRWSAYEYDGYGSMEDETVVFLPDGTGWFAFERAELYERETFAWSLDAGRLSIHPLEYAALPEQGGAPRTRPSDGAPMVVAISLADEPVQWPGAERRPVLAFEAAPFAGATRFALAQRGAELPFPRFAGETAPDTTLALLLAADDAERAERPDNFDWQRAINEVRAIKPELERLAGQPFALDENVQDASFFADLSIQEPGLLPTVIDTVLAFRFSAFGRLVAVWRHAQVAEIQPETLSAMLSVLRERGFVVVERAALDAPYSGRHPRFQGASWWARLFDWL